TRSAGRWHLPAWSGGPHRRRVHSSGTTPARAFAVVAVSVDRARRATRRQDGGAFAPTDRAGFSGRLREPPESAACDRRSNGTGHLADAPTPRRRATRGP